MIYHIVQYTIIIWFNMYGNQNILVRIHCIYINSNWFMYFDMHRNMRLCQRNYTVCSTHIYYNLWIVSIGHIDWLVECHLLNAKMCFKNILNQNFRLIIILEFLYVQVSTLRCLGNNRKYFQIIKKFIFF